jgi:hypothetical protein
MISEQPLGIPFTSATIFPWVLKIKNDFVAFVLSIT